MCSSELGVEHIPRNTATMLFSASLVKIASDQPPGLENMTLSTITSLEIRKLRQVMNIFKVFIFAVDSLAVICANTRPCRFNMTKMKGQYNVPGVMSWAARESRLRNPSRADNGATQPLQRTQVGIRPVVLPLGHHRARA